MFTILYQDQDLLVINKPAGVVVNRAASVKGKTVQDFMDENFDIQKASAKLQDEEFVSRSGLVHRIDKETSGALVLAKTPHAFAHLKNQFKERLVQKQYTALAHDAVVPSEGTVHAPVGRLPWNRMRFGVFPGGRDAYSKYKVVRLYNDKSGHAYSLVSVYPRTGRTHQIRVHLQYINHPIVSDPLYAGKKRAKTDRAWCTRLFLHAATLSFALPTSGKQITIECPLPKELELVLATLTSN